MKNNHDQNNEMKPMLRWGSVFQVLGISLFMPVVFLATFWVLNGIESIKAVHLMLAAFGFLLVLPIAGLTLLHFYTDKVVLVRWLWSGRRTIMMDDVIEFVELFGQSGGVVLVYFENGKKKSRTYSPGGGVIGKMTFTAYCKKLGFMHLDEYRGRNMRHWINPRHIQTVIEERKAR